MRSQMLCDIRYRAVGSILLFALSGSVAVAPSAADQQPPAATRAHAPQADLLLRPHNGIIQGTDQSALIREARHAYYSLKGEGLEEVRCQAVPDWESIFKTMRPSPVNPDQLLPLLEKLRFQVAIGPSGGAMVSQVSDFAPPSEEMAERVQKMAGAVVQFLHGFFDTWAPFAFGTFFSDSPAKFEFDEAQSQYRITKQKGPVVVVTTMTLHFLVTQLLLKTPQIEIVVRPQFVSNTQGYMLTGLGSVFSKGETELADYKMDITYMQVQGFTLPQTLTGTVDFPTRAQSATVALKFINYQITKQ